jgi:hypothetical protein
MTESVQKYLERKAFESAVVMNLTQQMGELYSMRREMDDCLKELDASIKEAENNLLNIVNKVGD